MEDKLKLILVPKEKVVVEEVEIEVEEEEVEIEVEEEEVEIEVEEVLFTIIQRSRRKRRKLIP
jgi:hypothetical protein